MTLNRNLLFSGGLALAGCAVLALGLACGGGGSSATGTTTPNTGMANVLITDAPSDTWSTVQVQVTNVTLFNQANHAQTTVVFSGNATINLVDMDSIGELLAAAQVPVGTYDQMQITVNTDPTTMSIIPAGGGVAIPSGQIHVVGNGVVTVALLPVLTVSATASNAVQVDFDLSHPLFINQTSNGVVLNFEVKHKPNPAALSLIQLHRHLGTIKSVGASANTFVMTTQFGHDLTLTTDSNTLFYDTDTHPFTSGSYAGLVAAEGVMAASRLQDDGSLYAVRVWYCVPANAASLPKWSPEGHVMSVDKVNHRMVVDNADGVPRTISITNATVFTFQENVTLSNPSNGGNGQAVLADINHGFKVSIAVADPLATPLVATAVNIDRAVDTGYIDSSTTNSTLTYGQAALANFRHYPYSATFSWWDFEQPNSASTDVNAFVAALQGAGTTRVYGASTLTWDAVGSAWDADTAILEPVVLPVATITQGYNAGSNTMQISYTDPLAPGSPTLKTIVLNPAAGGGQTLVVKVATVASAVSAGLDLPANWATDLTPTATKVWVSVVPQSNGNLDAYSVLVQE
jgi:hypothetical protein